MQTMSDKKCVCGAKAEWELKGECYCEFCARGELDVRGIMAPRICEMCGDPLDRMYYTDGKCNAFCTVKCALEYYDAREIEQEQEDDDD